VVTRDGLQVDLRVVPPDSFGAALLYFTGSKAHNIRLRQRALRRGMTLNEYALARLPEDVEVDADADAEDPRPPPRSPGATSRSSPSAPRRRSTPRSSCPGSRGAARGRRRGGGRRGGRAAPSWSPARTCAATCTTTPTAPATGATRCATWSPAPWSAGTSTSRSPTTPRTSRSTGSRATRCSSSARSCAELEQERGDIRLLHGAELNIGVDGSLDYDDEFLAGFDWLVASVHSHFGRDVEEQTARVLAAIRHPSVTAIGHLQGRMLGKRAGIELDLDAVLDAAVETGTAIEINANLRRLDASAEVIREGARRGVTFVISTDAHAVGELDNLRHGVANARRGRLPVGAGGQHLAAGPLRVLDRAGAGRDVSRPASPRLGAGGGARP
jgi:DNA polymerase (family X)